MINHDFNDAAGMRVEADLFDDPLGVGGVVNDPKGINEVVGFYRDKLGQLFGISPVKANPLLKAINLQSPGGDFQRLLGKFHRRHPSTVAGEIDRVGADTTADFQHPLAFPTREFCEGGDVRFYEILAGFYFIEVLPRPDGFSRMADIAGPMVPKPFHGFDGDRLKRVFIHPK